MSNKKMFGPNEEKQIKCKGCTPFENQFSLKYLRAFRSGHVWKNWSKFCFSFHILNHQFRVAEM